MHNNQQKMHAYSVVNRQQFKGSLALLEIQHQPVIEPSLFSVMGKTGDQQ